MNFKSLGKIDGGKFINRYNVIYETVDGKTKVYEMVSRDGEIDSFERLHGAALADAVVLIMHNEDRSKILINKEFRMAPGMWVYNFPAGLIDPGENPEEAAARELREETGLHLERVDDYLPPSYSAVGFSNEKNVCIVGTASGEFSESDSTLEEIHAKWFTKAEVREMLKTECFAARTQAYCYLWSRE